MEHLFPAESMDPAALPKVKPYMPIYLCTVHRYLEIFRHYFYNHVSKYEGSGLCFLLCCLFVLSRKFFYPSITLQKKIGIKSLEYSNRNSNRNMAPEEMGLCIGHRGWGLDA